MLAIAADGAGSAARSDEGARVTVDRFLDVAEQECRTGGMIGIDRAFIDRWILLVKEQLASLATDCLGTMRDFACTALGAVVGERESVFFQIGDGAIVAARNNSDTYEPIFMPQHGEFANSTNFIIQDDTPEILEFRRSSVRCDELAIFTDGIERLVLNIADRTAHAPFFRPLFLWLSRTSPEDTTQSAMIKQYLESAAICERTDDDKTLILATRRVGVPC